MDHAECLAEISRLAERGWAYRDQLIAAGPLTPEVVLLEDALHALEQALARLRAALARLRSTPSTTPPPH